MRDQPRLNPSAPNFIPTFGTGTDLVRSSESSTHSSICSSTDCTSPGLNLKRRFLQASWAQTLTDKQKTPVAPPGDGLHSKPAQGGVPASRAGTAAAAAASDSSGTSRAQSGSVAPPPAGPGQAQAAATPSRGRDGRAAPAAPRAGGSSSSKANGSSGGARGLTVNGAGGGAWGSQNRSRQDGCGAAPPAPSASAAPAVPTPQPALPAINTQPSQAPRPSNGDAGEAAGRRGQRGSRNGGGAAPRPSSGQVAAVKTQPVTMRAQVSLWQCIPVSCRCTGAKANSSPCQRADGWPTGCQAASMSTQPALSMTQAQKADTVSCTAGQTRTSAPGGGGGSELRSVSATLPFEQERRTYLCPCHSPDLFLCPCRG